MRDVRDALGHNIRSQRQRLGLSQEALGEKAEIHWTFVGHIERGQKLPSLRVLVRLAEALHTTPSKLLRGLPRD